ncbi:hypothetical protein Tco_0294702 [Tanacetum coccineum]
MLEEEGVRARVRSVMGKRGVSVVGLVVMGSAGGGFSGAGDEEVVVINPGRHNENIGGHFSANIKKMFKRMSPICLSLYTDVPTDDAYEFIVVH